jgi:hypothetical protein
MQVAGFGLDNPQARAQDPEPPPNLRAEDDWALDIALGLPFPADGDTVVLRGAAGALSFGEVRRTVVGGRRSPRARDRPAVAR